MNEYIINNVIQKKQLFYGVTNINRMAYIVIGPYDVVND